MARRAGGIWKQRLGWLCSMMMMVCVCVLPFTFWQDVNPELSAGAVCCVLGT